MPADVRALVDRVSVPAEVGRVADEAEDGSGKGVVDLGVWIRVERKTR
jgi:hypothetical protein